MCGGKGRRKGGEAEIRAGEVRMQDPGEGVMSGAVLGRSNSLVASDPRFSRPSREQGRPCWFVWSELAG